MTCPVPFPRSEVTCEDTLIAADSLLSVSSGTGTGTGSTRGQDGVCVLLKGVPPPSPLDTSPS
jgi:hypothetical protein